MSDSQKRTGVGSGLPYISPEDFKAMHERRKMEDPDWFNTLLKQAEEAVEKNWGPEAFTRFCEERGIVEGSQQWDLAYAMFNDVFCIDSGKSV